MYALFNTISRFMTASTFQGVYTKIFLQFPDKFWFDTEVSSRMSIDSPHLDVLTIPSSRSMPMKPNEVAIQFGKGGFFK